MGRGLSPEWRSQALTVRERKPLHAVRVTAVPHSRALAAVVEQPVYQMGKLTRGGIGARGCLFWLWYRRPDLNRHAIAGIGF